MILAEFSMYPVDKGESLSKYVARSLEIIDKSGLEYRVNQMGTCVEGEYDEVMNLVKQCFDKMSEDCDRVVINMKVDYRKGRSGSLSSKIASVEEKVGKELKK